MPVHMDDFPIITETRAEGQAEGRAEERAENVRHLVERRYGDPALTAQLEALAPDALDEAFDLAIDANRDTFASWLAANISK